MSHFGMFRVSLFRRGLLLCLVVGPLTTGEENYENANATRPQKFYKLGGILSANSSHVHFNKTIAVRFVSLLIINIPNTLFLFSFFFCFYCFSQILSVNRDVDTLLS